jgi:hypothetical protein
MPLTEFLEIPIGVSMDLQCSHDMHERLDKVSFIAQKNI